MYISVIKQKWTTIYSGETTEANLVPDPIIYQVGVVYPLKERTCLSKENTFWDVIRR